MARIRWEIQIQIQIFRKKRLQYVLLYVIILRGEARASALGQIEGRKGARSVALPFVMQKARLRGLFYYGESPVPRRGI